MKREQEKVKTVFEGSFKFAASEASKRFNNTASADRGENEEQSGRNVLVIEDQAIEQSLVINEKSEEQLEINGNYLFFDTTSACHETL